MAIPDLLKSCPLFFELYEKEVEKIVRHCAVYRYDPGGYIVKDGDEGDEIFVLLSGSAMVEKDVNGNKVQIQPLKSGDVFGELALLGSQKRQADIVALEHSDVLEIGYSSVFTLYKKEPKIFGLMLLNVSRLITQRLASSNQIIVKLQGKLNDQGGGAA